MFGEYDTLNRQYRFLGKRMKKDYIVPEIDVIDLPQSDVIATSSLEQGENNDGGGWGQIQGK